MLSKSTRVAKFKVGDRVRHYGYGLGVILDVDGSFISISIAVRFDEYNNGRFHDAGGLCEMGHGKYCTESSLTLAERKVKPTRLAKKMYPDAREENGYLILEE